MSINRPVCVVDTYIISDLVHMAINHGSFKVARIINNVNIYKKAVCLFRRGSIWIRLEVNSNCTGDFFLYHTNHENFIDSFFSGVFHNKTEVKDLLNDIYIKD